MSTLRSDLLGDSIVGTGALIIGEESVGRIVQAQFGYEANGF